MSLLYLLVSRVTSTLTTEVWSNHRVGILNSINPQASKMHRNWIHSKAWETEIDISENADLTEFLLSVGAGFDITAEAIQRSCC